jgi:hypothetical protein
MLMLVVVCPMNFLLKVVLYVLSAMPAWEVRTGEYIGEE